jgi:diacylglycerol kinase family enzyme
LPAGGVVVGSDAEARRVVERHRRQHQPVPPLGLVGGDLWRTLGGRGDADRLRSPDAVQVPVDVGAALIDGRLHWFVAHLVARRSWWWGRVVAVMNAEFHGAWDVAPGGHPNDGRLDVLEADLRLGDRLKARARLPAGAHVPHPGIKQRRVDAAQFDFDVPTRVWLDGEPVGRVRRLSVRVEPDAVICVI